MDLRLSDELNNRIQALMADDQVDPALLLARLERIRKSEGAPVHAAALRLLAHMNVPQAQAAPIIEGLIRHRKRISAALGRDPGLRVAAIDYLSNVKRLLVNPAIVESSQLERARRSALTDSLTRLTNRRHFMEVLANELRRSHRYSLRLTLLMLDVDGFKKLNDRHGHLFGDRVLKRVGRILRRNLREADTPSRFGGDEFAVVLPETDRLGAYAVAERLRGRVADSCETRPISGIPARVRLSGGIASYPVDGEDPPGLIARADQALYLAKRDGKNRIRLFHSEKRVAVRYPARSTLEIRFRVQGVTPILKGRPLDLSRTGVLIETGRVADESTRVELEFVGFDRNGRPCRWRVPGVVVRCDAADRSTTVRLGIRFEQSLMDECLFQQVLRTSALRAVQGGRG